MMYHRFGEHRFKVSEYVGANWHNYRADECVKFFDDAVADGDLEIAPGPHGRRGCWGAVKIRTRFRTA